MHLIRFVDLATYCGVDSATSMTVLMSSMLRSSCLCVCVSSSRRSPRTVVDTLNSMVVDVVVEIILCVRHRF
jgi:hypothetical protein